MATERGGFNAVPALVHVVAIAVGVWLGFVVMDAIVPALPDADVEPGLSTSTAPGSVAGDDPDSLFRASNLAPALSDLAGQLAAGDAVAVLHIEPGSLDAETAAAEGAFAPADVPPQLPALLVDEIDAERGGLGLADVRYIDLVATANRPRWYVQLDTSREIGPPPWTYGAPLDGSPLTAGPAPPIPVG